MTGYWRTETRYGHAAHARSDGTSTGTAHSTVGELSGDNTTGKPSFNYDQAGAQISRDNRKWDGGELGTAGDVTYSFLSNSQAGGGYRQLTAEQMASTKKAMDIISSVANITFNPADGGSGNNISDQGEIRFQGYDGGGGWASWSYRGGGATAEITSSTVALGSASLSLALHEIGHAIALSHPGDYNGGGFSYENDAEFYQDSEQYTVMSYWSGEKTGAVLGRFVTDENGQSVYIGGATGLGLYDIAALQRVYGANQSTYNADTTYGFNSNTGDDGWTLTGKTDWIQAAIWDTGGNDTIDMSGYSEDAELDLREESFSSTGGLKYNLSIARGAVIENAIGGAGDDTIRGNAVANELIGGGGNDTLRGDGGDDRLVGGDGSDTAIFSGNFADYLISLVSDGVYALTDKLERDGKDTLSAIESFLFADGNKTEAEIRAAATDTPVDPDPVDPDPVDPDPVDPDPVDPDPVDPDPVDPDPVDPDPVDPDPVDPDPVDPDPVDPDPVDPDPVDPDPVDPDPVDPDPVDPDPVDPDPVDPTGGNDTLIFEPGTFNTLNGGDGNDTADFSRATSAVYVDLGWEGNEAWTTGTSSLYWGWWQEIADLESIENITGSDFHDLLAGDGGNNTLVGGEGRDWFRFDADFGADTIGDFQDGSDAIWFTDNRDIRSFDQLTITQNGDDAVISHGTDTVTVTGVDASLLTADDFYFC